MGKKTVKKPKAGPVSGPQKGKKSLEPETTKPAVPETEPKEAEDKKKEVKTYQIKGDNLLRNGKLYREKSFIDLTEDEARPLMRILVLKLKTKNQ